MKSFLSNCFNATINVCFALSPNNTYFGHFFYLKNVFNKGSYYGEYRFSQYLLVDETSQLRNTKRNKIFNITVNILQTQYVRSVCLGNFRYDLMLNLRMSNNSKAFWLVALVSDYCPFRNIMNRKKISNSPLWDGHAQMKLNEWMFSSLDCVLTSLDIICHNRVAHY